MITPRKTFQLNKVDVQAHKDLVDSPQFQRWCQIAVAELAVDLPSPGMNEAMAQEYRRQGVNNFIRVFMGLSSEAKPAPPRGLPALEPETEH
jgi:hypothetical protein